MDYHLVQGSNDFKVPNERYLLSPSSNDWLHWGVSEFENDDFSMKYISKSTKENLTNFNSDSRERKVPQVLAERSSSSSASEDCFMADRSMRTSDDFFDDFFDFEMQNSMQKMDDIFLNSFLEQDLMHSDNAYELSDTIDSMNLPWSLRTTVLENFETMTEESTRREDGDPNFRELPVELSPIAESSATVVESEPLCMEATVLQELENVMLQLNTKTRISIRDSLYRLANRSKDQHSPYLCQSASVMDLPSNSEICCGNSRQELSRSLESKTNVIDRAIATLMFDRS